MLMGNPNHLPGGSSKGGEFTSQSYTEARGHYFDAQKTLFAASNFNEVTEARANLHAAEKTMDATPEGVRSLKLLASTSDDKFERAGLRKRLEEAEKNLAVRSGKTGDLSTEDLPLIPAVKHTYEVPEYKVLNSDDSYPATVGSKYTKYMPAKEVTAAVRLDLKEAQKKGYLPSHLKYSVTTKDNAVRVEIKGIPDSKIYKDKDARRRDDVYHADALELEKRVRGIAGAYNYSRSQIQTDYHDEMYYTQTTLQDDAGRKFQAEEAARAKQGRERRTRLNGAKDAFRRGSIQALTNDNYTVTERGSTTDGKAKVLTVDDGNMVLVDYGHKVDAYQFDTDDIKDNTHTFLNYDPSWFKYSEKYRVKNA